MKLMYTCKCGNEIDFLFQNIGFFHCEEDSKLYFDCDGLNINCGDCGEHYTLSIEEDN